MTDDDSPPSVLDEPRLFPEGQRIEFDLERYQLAVSAGNITNTADAIVRVNCGYPHIAIKRRVLITMIKNQGEAAMNFSERYGPWAIIAGASEGTGRSFAQKVAARGVSCILIAHGGPLEEVAEEIRAESNVECITAKIDLSAPDALHHILAVVGNKEIGLYVANAGGDASASRFHDRDYQTWLNLLHLNVITTMHACHHFGGLMQERRHGGLLIVNSGACYGGGSYLAVYSAAKAFLLNLSEALWAELAPSGVDVLSIALDRTDTPNFRRLQARIGQPMPTNIASPDDVAEMGLTHLRDGPLYNFGFADNEAGPGWQSASARRERVVAMSASTMKLYGKTEMP